MHRTTVDGVFAAGDTCTKHPHLAGTIDSGSKTAMMMVQSLLADEFGLPYPPP
jgi:thioredoxin reductase